VVPAAGSIHAAVRIDPLRMAELVRADWVDVCQEPSTEVSRTTT
jgi:prolyl-tRNA editing enzyme YbaK/EbsC (Cys-tRNA(Pro) deacylase)